MRSLHWVCAGSLLGLVLLGGCGSSGGGVDAGHVAPARSDTVGGKPVSMTVPTGRIEVTVGDPVSSVSADDTSDRTELKAPDGGALVPISWVFDSSAAPWTGLLGRPAKEATVSLVDRGRVYPVGAPYSTNGTAMAPSPRTAFFVAVGDRPKLDDLAVKVAYDGGAQVADVATGKAAAGSPSLADITPGSPGTAPCPNSGWTSDDPALRVALDCSIGLVGQTPYFPGAGWAPSGKTFVVVDVSELRILDAKATQGGGSTTYRVTAIADHSTLGSVTPRTRLVPQGPPREYVAAGPLVFEVAPGSAGPLRLSVEVTLEADNVTGHSTAPDTRTVRLSHVVPLAL